MYAIFVSGGKQYKVYKGAVVKLEKLNLEIGKQIQFNHILMISNKLDTMIGNPFVKNSIINAQIIANDRLKKINIFKFNRRKHYKKLQGHRQYYTEIRILNIIINTNRRNK